MQHRSSARSGEVRGAGWAEVDLDKAEAAYARGTLFDKRRSPMADWARFCDKVA